MPTRVSTRSRCSRSTRPAQRATRGHLAWLTRTFGPRPGTQCLVSQSCERSVCRCARRDTRGEAVFEPVEGGAASVLQAARPARKELEVLRGRCPGAPALGCLPAGVLGDAAGRQHQLGTVVCDTACSGRPRSICSGSAGRYCPPARFWCCGNSASSPPGGGNRRRPSGTGFGWTLRSTALTDDRAASACRGQAPGVPLGAWPAGG